MIMKGVNLSYQLYHTVYIFLTLSVVAMAAKLHI